LVTSRQIFLSRVLELLSERLSSGVLGDARQVLAFVHSMLHSADDETLSLALALLTGLLAGPPSPF
jgi:hypothetical protein